YLLMFCFSFLFFSFQDTAITNIYTLSLHDALPISTALGHAVFDFINPAITLLRIIIASVHYHNVLSRFRKQTGWQFENIFFRNRDRKSTRLNSSHVSISYAVFCLKKKKNNYQNNN